MSSLLFSKKVTLAYRGFLRTGLRVFRHEREPYMEIRRQMRISLGSGVLSQLKHTSPPDAGEQQLLYELDDGTKALKEIVVAQYSPDTGRYTATITQENLDARGGVIDLGPPGGQSGGEQGGGGGGTSK